MQWRSCAIGFSLYRSMTRCGPKGSSVMLSRAMSHVSWVCCISRLRFSPQPTHQRNLTLADCAALLEALPLDRFNDHRSSLQAASNQPFQQLFELFDSTWLHLTKWKHRHFGSRFHLADSLDAVTKDDIKQFFTTFLAPSCTNRRKLVIQSWAAGSTPKVVESSTRVAVHDHLDAWKAMQNLFSCPDNFLV